MNSVPKLINLKQNYPNLFNPATIVEFSIPENGLVKLIVYDLLGEQIDILVSIYLEAGNYKTIWEAKELAGGIYFYNLSSGKFSQVKKMILLR